MAMIIAKTKKKKYNKRNKFNGICKDFAVLLMEFRISLFCV